MDEQNKNLILATVLSFLVIMVWFVLFPPAPPEQQPATPEAAQQQTGTPSASSQTGEVATPAPAAATSTQSTRDDALGKTERVPVHTARLTGSISLKGGRLDDLKLTGYHKTIAPDSPLETLLSPTGGPNSYYVYYGWWPVAGSAQTFDDVPGANTAWSLESGETLSETTPVRLIWDNGKGLVFHREISVDENYMFSISQSVENRTGTDIQLAPYGTIARHGKPDVIGFYILHEGVVRVSDGELQEIKYKKMPDADFNQNEQAAFDSINVEANGWTGFTDKYWMTSLIPEPGQGFNSVSKYTKSTDTYQTDMRLPVLDIADGQTSQITTLVFAGAKEWETIHNYQENLGIEKFIDSIDWGLFFFLTKPIFRALHFFNGVIGNMGLAIIALTVLIKTLLFPLAYKSYVSMSKMKKLQPEMEKVKERAGDDRAALQKEMMALYKKEKVNPAAGCLPILLQIPIFFSLYKVIFVTIELRQAPFFGWIQDLSLPDPSSVLNLFGLLPWAAPGPESVLAILSIGVFPILMGVTMWLQQKLNPAPTDKTQAMIFAWMPWVFMFMLGRFASGLVVYWVANNTITFIQQYTIMRSQGVKPDIFGNILGRTSTEKAK